MFYCRLRKFQRKEKDLLLVNWMTTFSNFFKADSSFGVIPLLRIQSSALSMSRTRSFGFVLAYEEASDRSSQIHTLDHPKDPCHFATISQCHLHPLHGPLGVRREIGMEPNFSIGGVESSWNGFMPLFLIQSKPPSICFALSLAF